MNEERGAGGKSYPTPRFPVGRQPDTDASDLGRELMRRLFENGRGVLVFRTQLREAPTHAVSLWVLLQLLGGSASRLGGCICGRTLLTISCAFSLVETVDALRLLVPGAPSRKTRRERYWMDPSWRSSRWCFTSEGSRSDGMAMRLFSTHHSRRAASLVTSSAGRCDSRSAASISEMMLESS